MAVENCDYSNKSEFNMHILVSFHDGTFGISSDQSFFKPKLPPKSDIDDLVTLLKSWLDSKKAVAVRWPAGDDICNSWNLFDYADEAPSCNENDKSLHSKHIVKSGVIVFYSESEDDMRKERDKFILQASNNNKKYLKTKDAKKKFGYQTTRQPVAKKHSMNKKSVSAEKSATNLQPALADDNLLSSPLKSLAEEDCIPPSTEKKRKEKKKSTSSRPIEKSATSEVILHPTAVISYCHGNSQLHAENLGRGLEKNNVKCVAVITQKQINSAICAKLIGCHNLMKKINQKTKSHPSNSITTAADGSDAE